MADCRLVVTAFTDLRDALSGLAMRTAHSGDRTVLLHRAVVSGSLAERCDEQHSGRDVAGGGRAIEEAGAALALADAASGQDRDAARSVLASAERANSTLARILGSRVSASAISRSPGGQPRAARVASGLAEGIPTPSGPNRYSYGVSSLPVLASPRGPSNGPRWLTFGLERSTDALAEERAEPSSRSAASAPASIDSFLTSLLPTQVSNEAALAPAQLRRLQISTGTGLDPRLQLAIANRRSGKKGLMTASTAGDEVAVIARVSSLEDWVAIPDVVPGSDLGDAGGTRIVTGRIPIERAEAVRSAPGVVSMKAAQRIRPALKATIEAMGAASADMPPGFDPRGGEGVVVGVVDFGCDFAHANFRDAVGATRIEVIWDQGGVAAADSPFGYGRVYRAEAIDAALGQPDPYQALGYGPDPDGPNQSGTHGTHVMDIAAGNGRGSGQAGVAPDASIIFVEASSSDISWAGPATVGQSFGDSVQLLEAVRFIFDEAGDRPCVVNLSLGTNGGPHDGSSLVEQGLDALLEEADNRAVVIAASNSQLDGIHTSGRVAGSGRADVVWNHTSSGGGEFELWYPGEARLSVELVAPDGTVFGPVAPDSNLPLGSTDVVIFISSRLADPNNRDNVIGIWIADRVAGGAWTVRLSNEREEDADYHAWIERNDRAQSSFAAAVATHTLGSISTGRTTIAVGSFDAHKAAMPISSFSSCGPTRDGREKPEVSAPGHAVIAARSRTTGGVTRKSGTSMAAPAVTGLIALVYADALRSGTDLAIGELRSRLEAGALRSPPAGAVGDWNDRYGLGRAHV